VRASEREIGRESERESKRGQRESKVERERERRNEKESARARACAHDGANRRQEIVCVHVGVCVRERQRECMCARV